MFNFEVCIPIGARKILELKSPQTTKPPILFGCLALEVYTRITNIVRHLWCGLLVYPYVYKALGGASCYMDGSRYALFFINLKYLRLWHFGGLLLNVEDAATVL